MNIATREPSRADGPGSTQFADDTDPESVAESLSTPFRLPAGLAPSDDLTHRAQHALPLETLPFTGEPCYERLFEAICRGLHRRQAQHLLLTGERGVGKSTIVAELARRAAQGQIGFLREKRFIWIDARHTPPMEKGPRLAAILAHLASRPNLVACLEGMATLLRGEQGQDHRLFLVSVLARAPFRLVGLVTPHEYEELTSDMPDMLDFFSRVNVGEPDIPLAQKLLHHYAKGLQESFSMKIAPEAVHQAVILSANYLLNDQLPAKAVKVLAHCCEEHDYERAMAQDEAVGQQPREHDETPRPPAWRSRLVRYGR